MDLTDTWVQFYDRPKANRRRRAGQPIVLHCGLCEANVAIDEDFDIFSSHHAVIQNVVDDGSPIDPATPGVLAVPTVPGGSPRMIEDRIICMGCASLHVPELAAIVTSYRQLRAKREKLVNAAH